MIVIRLTDNITATFDGDSWACNDADWQRSLNFNFEQVELTVGDAYRVSEYDDRVLGIDAVALDANAHLVPEIIVNRPIEPIEQEGVVV